MQLADRYFARKENRRADRKKLREEGWIKFDGSFAAHKCLVVDLSVTGAKISGVRVEMLRRGFTLSFTRDGRQAKRCAVAWHEAGVVGVKFI